MVSKTNEQALESKKYKIFCDESNHLYSDKSDLMVIGGILCPSDEVEYTNRYIKFLKYKHNARNELKWTKLNSNKKLFYKELLEFFFSRVNLKFNAQVVVGKSNLNHEFYNSGDPDIFYYKMYYYTLLHLLNPENNYNIFIDYKDTKGGKRAEKLREVIQNKFYGEIDVDFTIIHSHESQIIQITDLIIGAIGYKNRKDIEKKSDIKNYIIKLLEDIGGFPLDMSIPQWENKFHIYQLHARRN